MINFEQKKSPLGLSYAAWDSVLDNPNAWSARMQLTGQWQCKRVVKWNAISQAERYTKASTENNHSDRQLSDGRKVTK
ncbi:hypothetical protein [Pseudomonas protegens]|jgi:hypothetical protein|uniref:hypothetical protein n=1 Tax=Pseudomonas protegens TaxID=380021 RepID=UPI0019D717BC|nr:hypothetical protein [Pseudomonas protegens]